METPEEESTTRRKSLGTLAEVEVLGPCKRRIKATVPSSAVQERLDSNYQELAASVQLPGFRRGRVPRRLLEKRYGADINADVKESLLGQSLAEVIEKHELKLFGSPSFEEAQFAPGEDFHYEVEIEVQPEFDLPEYKGIEVDAELRPVEAAEIDEELEKIRRSRSTLVAIEPQKAGADDFFQGYYELYRDGVRVKSRTEASFRPSQGWIVEFEIAQLPEKVKSWTRQSGEPLVLTVTVPPYFADEVLRGKEVELRFHLSETKAVEAPSLDEALAQAMGYESLEELRKDVRESLETARERDRDRAIEDKIVQLLVDQVHIDLPEDFLKRQQEASSGDAAPLAEAPEEDRMEAEAAAEPPKSVASGEGEAEDDVERMKKKLKEVILLGRIGDKEKIFVTEDEVNKRVAVIATLNRIPPARLREELSESGRLDEMRLALRTEKIKAFLRRKAKISGAGPEASGGGSAEPETPAPPAEAGSPG
ncbi:MAG: trigger factor [Planctomycetes bacterium]|nr:trigger factor [Planctomycetota bacterium]